MNESCGVNRITCRTMSRTAVSIEVVSDPSRFQALQAVWAPLLRQCRQQTVFLQWEWLHTWWQVFATNNMTLQILLLSSGDRLVGAAPFYVQHSGFPRGRILRFIGTGEPEKDHVVSEYLDIFALPEYEQSAVNAVSDWVRSNGQWRQIRLDDVLSESLSLKLMQNLQVVGTQQKKISGHRYFIELPETFDAYLQQLSSSRRSRFRRCLKALKKDGADSQPVAIDSIEGIDASMNTLKELNHLRWRDRAGRGVFESEPFHQFHLQLCRLLWPTGQADIKVLQSAEKSLAALYVFYSDHVGHYYQSGFTQQHANRYMPLFVSHMNEIADSIGKGLKRYDFMRGAADSYKKDYACDSEPMYTIRIWRNLPDHQLSNLKALIRDLVKTVVARISRT